MGKVQRVKTVTPIRDRQRLDQAALLLLGGQAEAHGGIAPDLLQISVHGIEALVMEPVEPSRALGRGCHQPGLFEQTEVPGDRRPGDRHLVCDLADRAFAAVQQLEDRAAMRIGERVEGIRRLSGHGFDGSPTVTVTSALP